MVEMEKPVTRRPWRCMTFTCRRGARPLKGDFGRTLLPPNWKMKDDADALAEIREYWRWHVW